MVLFACYFVFVYVHVYYVFDLVMWLYACVGLF